jgi:sugar/nucleoside kinase (ribokinase family)
MTILQLVGLGMATVDILARSARSARSADGDLFAPGTGLEELVLDGGGMACNAMVAAKKLGAPAGFVGTFGGDRLGQFKLQVLRESGVDASRIVQRESPDDQVVVVHIHAGDGERSFYPVALDLRQALDPNALDRAYLTQAEYLLVDGAHEEAALRAAQWMHAAGKRVMLDATAAHGPPSPGMRRLVGACHFLVSSAGFCQALTGMDDLPAAARAALDSGPGVVVQTNGASGSDTFTRGETFHTPAFPVQAVDTTGAGDVFHGAYLVALLEGWDLRTSAEFASAAAALKCLKMGRAGYPTRAEVFEKMGDRRGET